MYSFVAFSVSDTNPVRVLSKAAENLVCNINEKEMYDKSTKKKASIQFYRTDLQNVYNKLNEFS